jgi:hypothetical protein
MERIVLWALDHRLHIVSDEIYALSIFDDSAHPFVSVAQACDPVYNIEYITASRHQYLYARIVESRHDSLMEKSRPPEIHSVL